MLYRLMFTRLQLYLCLATGRSRCNKETRRGRPGAIRADAALPRRDVKVVKDGVTVAPGLALGSWMAFKERGNEAMVLGDLVLTEEEIEPVMLKLQQQGIEQTSIHNHLLGESSRVIYMHIAGHGDPVAFGTLA